MPKSVYAADAAPFSGHATASSLFGPRSYEEYEQQCRDEQNFRHEAKRRHKFITKQGYAKILNPRKEY